MSFRLTLRDCSSVYFPLRVLWYTLVKVKFQHRVPLISDLWSFRLLNEKSWKESEALVSKCLTQKPRIYFLFLCICCFDLRLVRLCWCLFCLFFFFVVHFVIVLSKVKGASKKRRMQTDISFIYLCLIGDFILVLFAFFFFTSH